VNENQLLLSKIAEQLDEFCDSQKSAFEQISPDLAPLVEYSKALLTGGKRFRALFAYWSWIGSMPAADQQLNSEQVAGCSRAMVGITAALEMFHGAALVHDDLLDQSDTRRNAPSVHKRFEKLHRDLNWTGSPERFGIAGSVLVGDLMLGWSSEMFGNALLLAPSAEIEQACRLEFSRMRVEVMAGQYLDVVEENAALTRQISEAVARANRVMLYKTAKYSLEAPLLIGATFGGASPALKRGFSAFGIPLGLAFQLRDDVLGVFGDPAITGKPAGDDLREGKRTVLIGLTREAVSASVGKLIDEMLTAKTLEPEQIEFLQKVIVESGALAKTERMILELGEESLASLELLDIEPGAKMQLRLLAEKVLNRDS
jgi:geranylgeranyl diphosphate synthase type I